MFTLITCTGLWGQSARIQVQKIQVHLSNDVRFHHNLQQHLTQGLENIKLHQQEFDALCSLMIDIKGGNASQPDGHDHHYGWNLNAPLLQLPGCLTYVQDAIPQGQRMQYITRRSTIDLFLWETFFPLHGWLETLVLYVFLDCAQCSQR